MDAIPRDLRERAQWVVWRREERGGKATKVPWRADGSGRASSTDATSWSTFEQTVAGLEQGGFDGIGYVLTAEDGLVGLDLDQVLDEHRRLDAAELDGSTLGTWIHALATYTEVSPSGRGLRIIGRAAFPEPDRNGRKRGNYEAYQADRFLTITGDVFEGLGELRKMPQDVLDAFYAAAFPTAEREPRSSSLSVPVNLADRELLDKAFAARNGSEFQALYAGRWENRYASQSEADLALCSQLMFWSGNDPDRVDRLFRSSGLMRDKWDRRDYRDRTIQAALQKIVYDPSHEFTSEPGRNVEASELDESFSKFYRRFGRALEDGDLTPTQFLVYGYLSNTAHHVHGVSVTQPGLAKLLRCHVETISDALRSLRDDWGEIDYELRPGQRSPFRVRIVNPTFRPATSGVTSGTGGGVRPGGDLRSTAGSDPARSITPSGFARPTTSGGSEVVKNEKESRNTERGRGGEAETEASLSRTSSAACVHAELWLGRDGVWRCAQCEPPHYPGEVVGRAEAGS